MQASSETSVSLSNPQDFSQLAWLLSLVLCGVLFVGCEFGDGASCTSDSDCSDEAFCTWCGACVDEEQAEYGELFWCGERDSSDPDPDDPRDPNSGGSADCSSDRDCPVSGICTEGGVCQSGHDCFEDGRCDPGQECTDDSYCEPIGNACGASVCSPGWTCLDGECVEEGDIYDCETYFDRGTNDAWRNQCLYVQSLLCEYDLDQPRPFMCDDEDFAVSCPYCAEELW